MALVSVEEVTVEKTVPFLEEPQADFVSLVDHAANRTPFQIIKNEKALVVHAILTPKDVTLESLSDQASWLEKAHTDNVQEFESWNQYIQLQQKKFDSSSFSIQPIAESGSYAVVGSLKANIKKDDVLAFPSLDFPELLPADNMEAAVVEEMVPISYSFADLFWKELDGFVAIVQGVMAQSAIDPKKRKSTIMSALQSFGSFLSMATDAVGTQAAKIEKDTTPETSEEILKKFNGAIDEFKNSITPPIDTSGGSEMLFETKEEMQAFIVETITAMKADETDPTLKSITELTELVKTLDTDLKAVVAKQDELEHAVTATPSVQEDPTVVKSDKPKSKFRGVWNI
jgi:hypothetical protein